MPTKFDNPAFVDADFPRWSEYTRGDNGAPAFHRFAAFEDTVPAIPKADWPDLAAKIEAEGGGAELLVTRIMNQRNEGSCVSFACSQAMQVVLARQVGRDAVTQLSPISLYKRIGSSPSSGAMVSDGLEEMASRGILPLDTPENRAKFGNGIMPETGFHTPFPPDWQVTAAKFKAVEWLIVRSVDGLVTALLNQHPVVVGRSGHSICYTTPVYKDGQLYAQYVNSWGSWGFGDAGFPDGFGLDSERMIRSASNWAFALRSVVVS